MFFLDPASHGSREPGRRGRDVSKSARYLKDRERFYTGSVLRREASFGREVFIQVRF